MGIERLKGTTCTRVHELSPGNFTFEFGTATLGVDCLWRVMADGKVALTSRDHGQQFGRPAPVDAYVMALTLLKGRHVLEVSLVECSADLALELEGGYRLDIIADSSGYEPWNVQAPGLHLVALGGGGLADFSSREA